MNLWFSSLLLVAGLFLSSSAQSVEECRPLVTPLSATTFEPSYGTWIFIMGYIDSDPFKVLFDSCQSMWVHFRKDRGELVEDIGIRHPTFCKYGSSPVSIVRNTAVTDKTNFTCTYNSLPTPDDCEDCLLYMVNSRNTNELLHIMDVNSPSTIHQVKRYRALYLMARGPVISTEAQEHFKKQAKCLGFTGEPSFIYDTKYSLCEKNNQKNDEEDDDD